MGLMTTLGSGKGKTMKVIIVGGVALGIVGSLLAAVASYAIEREPAPAGKAHQAVAPVMGMVRTAGDVVVSDEWKVTVGDIDWRQSDAVMDADRDNPAPASGFEWATVPVTVANLRDSAAMAPVEVTLLAGPIAMSSSYKDKNHFPVSALPKELDVSEVKPGESVSGNVGWMVPSSTSTEGTCLLKVTVGKQSTVLACSGSNG